MTTVSYQTVTTRPSTAVNFVDFASLADYSNEYNNSLVVDTSVTVSADGLTRTMTRTYDDSIQPAIDSLNMKYASVLQAEASRASTAGITSATTKTQ